MTTIDNWMTLIIQYLKDGVLAEDKSKVKLLRLKVARYIMYDGQLCKKRLFYTTPEVCQPWIRELHTLGDP